LVITPSNQSVQIRTTTDAHGAYTFTRSESEQGTYWLQIDFYGNSNYSVASQMLFLTVGNPIPTTIRSLTTTNSNPGVNQPFTISGYLTDINGTALPGRSIWVNIRLPNGQWDLTGHTTTDSNGYFAVTYSEQTVGEYRFEFHFMGDTIYGHCGPALTVAVGTLQATKLSMNPSVTHPAVNQPFTLSGTLTDANGNPLAGKEVDLSRVVVGQPTNPGGSGYFDERYTDQNGHYSFALNENASGTYQYMTNFLGDQSYASSHFWMSLTVGTLTPTTLTVTASTTTPAVNQHVTLSGTLKADGIPLPGKTITLAREDPSGNWNHAVNTTTTDAHGAYTFTRSESASGSYRFEPIFDGAGAYASTTTIISLTVG
jgi:protocatechuate 3,4-dioxygenase beta subunit